MAKIIKYKFLIAEVNRGTEESPNVEQQLADVVVGWNETNEEIAKREAYNGEYTIEDGGEEVVIAPSNITAGEYVTVNNVLYKATENIPNGERIIVGQNAIKTTVEAQLYELMGG